MAPPPLDQLVAALAALLQHGRNPHAKSMRSRGAVQKSKHGAAGAETSWLPPWRRCSSVRGTHIPSQCTRVALCRNPTMAPPALNQLVAALAALLKRGWLDHPEQRQEFFQVRSWKPAFNDAVDLRHLLIASACHSRRRVHMGCSHSDCMSNGCTGGGAGRRRRQRSAADAHLRGGGGRVCACHRQCNAHAVGVPQQMPRHLPGTRPDVCGRTAH